MIAVRKCNYYPHCSMPLPASQSQSVTARANDATNLFSHFGGFTQQSAYRELVQEEAALIAASRWPLIAEIERIAPELVEGAAK